MDDYIIDLNKTGNKYYEGTDIRKIMILYEHACYDHVKLHNKYVNIDKNIIGKYNKDNVLNIIMSELEAFKIILKDHINTPNKDPDTYYGHWSILDWIYGRWVNDDQIENVKSHIKIIGQNKDKTCLEIVDQILSI